MHGVRHSFVLMDLGKVSMGTLSSGHGVVRFGDSNGSVALRHLSVSVKDLVGRIVKGLRT